MKNKLNYILHNVIFFYLGSFSAFHSRFFAPLRSTKRAPFKSGCTILRSNRNSKIVFKVFSTLLYISINCVQAQNVVFNKIETTHTNTDKFLYRIEKENPEAQFLAEIEIQGNSENPIETFNLIYKKAKEVGANAFAYQPFLTLDEKTNKLDPSHFKLNLYYLEKKSFSEDNNTIVLISTSKRSQKLLWNNTKIVLKPESFLTLKLSPGENYTLSTRHLFGSSIKLSYNVEQKIKYFLISAFQVKSDNSGVGGINLKSGDIISIEKSLGDYLSVVLQHNDY